MQSARFLCIRWSNTGQHSRWTGKRVGSVVAA
jgi:hypothetical protein